MPLLLLGAYFAAGGVAPPPAPAAVADTFEVTEGAVATPLDVLANDSNLTGRLITIVSQPSRGTLEILDNGLATAKLAWTDNGSGVGSTSGSYSVDGSLSATVQLTIRAAAPPANLPTFLQKGTADAKSNPANDILPTYPTASIQQGHVFFLQVTIQADTAIACATPAGWTLASSVVVGDLGQFVFSKVATGSESGTQAVDWSGTGGVSNPVGLAVIYRYDHGTTIESVATANGTGFTALIPSVTTTAPNRRVLAFLAMNDAATFRDDPVNTVGGTYVFREGTQTTVGDNALALLYDAAMAAAGTISGAEIDQDLGDRWSVIAFAIFGTATPPPPPSGFFVATNGNNANPGTESLPWRTIAFAMSQLSPGDRLNIRGGTYREAPFTWTKSGTSGSKVVVASYPGEVASIDCAYPEFQVAGNSAWELFHEATETYRSVGASYPSSSTWIGSFVTEGERLRLMPYANSQHLMSQNYQWDGNGDFYRGPGFVRSSDGRIYIRLQNLEGSRGAGIPAEAPDDHPIRHTPPTAGGFDPRTFSVHLSTVGDMFTVSADHVTFERVAFEAGDRGIVHGGTTGITYDRCRVRGSRVAVRMDSSNSFFTFKNGICDSGFPPYCSWNDVKATEAITGQNMKISTATLDPNNTDILFENNIFKNCFDGITCIQSGIHRLRILRNTWTFCFDDTAQHSNALTDFEIGWNFINGPIGGYNGGQSPAEADIHKKWFHHNVIDVRRDEFGFRSGQPNGGGTAWRRAHVAIGTHSTDFSGPIKIYNNTFLLETNINNDGARLERIGATDLGVHESYNNIVLQYDDREYLRGVKSGSHTILDYNLMWKFHSGSFALFNDWPPSASSPSTDYASLAAWRASQAFQDTKAHYAPGYEANSKQANPQLTAGANPVDLDYRPNDAGPAASGAKNLISTGWPGVSSSTYFGAVDPDAPTGLGDVGCSGTIGP